MTFIKNTWKRTESINSLSTKESEFPKLILNNEGNFFTKLKDIANKFDSFLILLHKPSSLMENL